MITFFRKLIVEYRALKRMIEYIESEQKTSFLIEVERILNGNTTGKFKFKGLFNEFIQTSKNYINKKISPTSLKDSYNTKELYKMSNRYMEMIDNEEKHSQAYLSSIYLFTISNFAILQNDLYAQLLLFRKLIDYKNPYSKYTKAIGPTDKYYADKYNFNTLADPEFIDLIVDLMETKSQHPKIDRLIKELNYYGHTKVIIFVKYRETANQIKQTLDQKVWKTQILMGKGSPGYNKKDQINAIEQFKNSDARVLITTITEGHNFQGKYSKDMVAYQYSYSMNPILKTQAKGRLVGRIKNGRYIKLKTHVPNDVSLDYRKDYVSTAREKKMEEAARNADTKRKNKDIELMLPFTERKPMVDD